MGTRTVWWHEMLYALFPYCAWRVTQGSLGPFWLSAGLTNSASWVRNSRPRPIRHVVNLFVHMTAMQPAAILLLARSRVSSIVHRARLFSQKEAIYGQETLFGQGQGKNR